MSEQRIAFVQEAELELGDGTDPAAVGAAVTTALCGQWKHEGPCRWPHNNEIELGSGGATFRTLYIASARDERDVRGRIDRSLREGVGWSVRSTAPRPVAPAEELLARRLAAGPTVPE